MECWLWIILAALCSECKGENKVTQPGGDITAAVGGTVTLNCTFETTDEFPRLFWYKQEVNSSPQYMLKCYSNTVDKAPGFQEDRFNAMMNKPSVPLMIQKLQLNDSAVYYCANLLLLTADVAAQQNCLIPAVNTRQSRTHQTTNIFFILNCNLTKYHLCKQGKTFCYVACCNSPR